ncbi:reverse transcriptase domain-containing protein [Tanacetum coccineum]
MVTSEGIRANPKKTKAISNLQSPKTLKEMQSLSGKLASLNRFLAKSAERALPFFNTLKNITKENKHEYRWTPEAEEAFQQMKRLIMSLPSLTPPFPEETLYAYLAVSREAVSAVLLTDRNGRQCPVQYVSRTLNEAERNYSPLEKLALSLVNMTRRLRRYFEAHPVKVITDQPIKNILSRTEASGKLAKYAVEIGTYKISFIPRNAVKGQVLADFLSDAPDGEREDEYFRRPEISPGIDDTEAWTLYTDGAASSKGSGAGLILTGPSGVEYAYALRLTFASTNNEAEYEALLAGLRIARMMNVLWIEVKDLFRQIMSFGKFTWDLAECHIWSTERWYWKAIGKNSLPDSKYFFSENIHDIPSWSSWPFYQWGMFILGPLDYGRRGAKYGLPRIIVTDNGAQLVSDPFKSWCKRFEIQQMNTAVAHPQANGLVERANRSLMEGIKTRLGREKAGWVDELPNVLWAHRTSIKQSNGETPFSLTYGSEAVIPAEIGMPSYRTLMIREEFNEEEQRLNLDLLQERREAAAIREARYKSKMEQYYNKKVRPAGFRPGEFVYRRNEASRVEDQGKLGPKWEGPYRVTEAFENGSYKLQTMEDKIVPRTWHAINLRKCYL